MFPSEKKMPLTGSTHYAVHILYQQKSGIPRETIKFYHLQLQVDFEEDEDFY